MRKLTIGGRPVPCPICGKNADRNIPEVGALCRQCGTSIKLGLDHPGVDIETVPGIACAVCKAPTDITLVGVPLCKYHYSLAETGQLYQVMKESYVD